MARGLVKDLCEFTKGNLSFFHRITSGKLALQAEEFPLLEIHSSLPCV